MAVDYFGGRRPEDEEDEQAAQQQIGPSSGAIANQQVQQGPGEGTSSGSYTNLQDYLSANAPSKFGERVAGKVGGYIDQAADTQQEVGQEFRQNVDENRVRVDDSLFSSVLEDPTSVYGDEAQRQSFIQRRDAEYGGPSNLTDREDLFSKGYGATNDAMDFARSTEDESGRKSLLDSLYGSGRGRYDYTSGQKSLDNLLIQNDPGSRGAFEDVRSRGDQLASDYEALEAALSEYATGAKQETQDTRSQARGLLGIDDAGNYAGSGAIGNLYGSLQGRVGERTSERDRILEDLTQAYAQRNSGSLPGGYENLGLGSYGPLYNLDVSQFLEGANDLNPNTVASPEEYARMAALTGLAGIENTFAPDEALAGTRDDEPLVSLNDTAFRQAQSNESGKLTHSVDQSLRADGSEIDFGGISAQDDYDAARVDDVFYKWSHQPGTDRRVPLTTESLQAQIQEIERVLGRPDLSGMEPGSPNFTQEAYDDKLTLMHGLNMLKQKAEGITEPLRQQYGYYDVWK